MKEINKQIGLFQTEAPSDKDLFSGRGHQRAADGLFKTIEENPEVHILGIEGGLGAGKSTSIKILENMLNRDRYYFVNFDVDQFHHSSTKAAFIKVLHHNLSKIVDHNKRTKINRAKDKALGNSLEYTKTTRSAISFLTVLFAMSLIFTVKNAEEAVGIVATSLSNVISGDTNLNIENLSTVLLALSPLFFPIILFISRLYKRRKGKLRELISIGDLLKRNGTDAISETFDVTREVGSYELREAFSDFVSAIPEGKVVILVIDNIDRVEPEKVREIWSDLDIFTSTANAKLKIILPYSEKHVSQAINKDNPSEGKEYISKRLPVVFRAPPIVSAGWREQFKSYWLETLGPINGVVECAELIDTWQNRAASITPRILKKHINDLACSISVAPHTPSIVIACSAYLLAVKSNDVNIGRFLSTTNENSKNEPESDVDKKIQASHRILNSISDVSDWSVQIACIHYQTSEEIAKSELLADPIERAIKGYDSKLLLSLSEIYGFDLFFLRSVENQDSREMIKVAYYISKEEGEEKKSWLIKWLPKINAKSYMEEVPKNCDNNYVNSVVDLKNQGYDISTNLIRRSISALENKIKQDVSGSESHVLDLHSYSMATGDIPKLIKTPSAELFVKKLWPMRDDLSGWDFYSISLSVDKITQIVKTISDNYVPEEHGELFKWLMPMLRLGDIDFTKTSANENLSVDFSALKDCECMVVPFTRNWLEETSISALMKQVINNDEFQTDEWVALTIAASIGGASFGGSINIRTDRGLNKSLKIGEEIQKLVGDSSSYVKQLNLILPLLPNFSSIIDALASTEALNLIKPSTRFAIENKKIHRLNINQAIGIDAYPRLSGIYEDNESKDRLIEFLSDWLIHVSGDISSYSTMFVKDIFLTGSDKWKSHLWVGFNDQYKTFDACKGLVANPEENSKVIVEHLRNDGKKIKASSELRKAIENLLKDIDENELLEYNNSAWLNSLITLLHRNSQEALFRRLQSRLTEQSIRLNERYAIIANFGSHISLNNAESSADRNTRILLLENSPNEEISQWLDAQKWDFKRWSETEMSHIRGAILLNDSGYERLKTMPELKLAKKSKVGPSGSAK